MSRYNISNVNAPFVDPKTGKLSKFGKDVLQVISEVLGLPGGNSIQDLEAGELYDPGIMDGRFSDLENTVRAIQDEIVHLNPNDSRVQNLEDRVRALELEISTLQNPDVSGLLSRIRALELEVSIAPASDNSVLESRLRAVEAEISMLNPINTDEIQSKIRGLEVDEAWL